MTVVRNTALWGMTKIETFSAFMSIINGTSG